MGPIPAVPNFFCATDWLISDNRNLENYKFTPEPQLVLVCGLACGPLSYTI